MLESKISSKLNLICQQETSCKPKKVLLLPFHIKIGLVKQFVKALDFEGNVLQKLCLMLPQLSDAKINGKIFVGPQILKFKV